MKNLKVLVIHCAYKFRGGEDAVVSEEIALLKANEVTVELLQFQNDKSSLLNLVQMPFNVSSYRKTRRKLKAFEPDIVHIHNLHFAASPSVFYAIKRSNTPFVVTLHNYRLICPSAILFNKGELFLDSLNQNFPWNAVNLGVFRNSKALTFWLGFSMYLHNRCGTWKMCNRFVVLSEFAQGMFLKSRTRITGDQLSIKPNFCTVPHLTNTNRKSHFLYVGRLSEEKGISLLLAAFAATKAKIKIAGNGPLVAEVQEAAKVYPNIEYLGNATKSEVFHLLKETTALVFPSVCFEGMPLTIIEAFACSTPVIASRLGAMQSMVSEGYNGLLFQPGNENDLIRVLTDWQSIDAEERNKYNDNAQQTYLNHYTPEKNYQKLMSVYRTVIEQHATVKKAEPIMSAFENCSVGDDYKLKASRSGFSQKI